MKESVLTAKARELTCEIPEQLHSLCANALNRFAESEATVHSPAYICNMVDSRLIPMVECLLTTYGEGILLRPYGF